MRFWKPALGVAVVLAIGFWDAGLPGLRHQSAPPSTPAISSKPVVIPNPSIMQPKDGLEFSAAFNGTRLNTKVWSTCYPWRTLPSCTNFGNKEYEWYVPGQDRVYGGLLHLVAQRRPTVGQNRQGGRKLYNCRSGIVTTYPGFRFRYGYIQIVAKIPRGPGLWPALWLAAASLKWPPEVDILESWGSGFSAAFFHPVDAPRGMGLIPHNLGFGWHVFSLSWTRARLIWSIDGRVILTVRKDVPHQKMYFLADLAEYVYPSRAAQCNGSLLIRSVKVWKN